MAHPFILLALCPLFLINKNKCHQYFVIKEHFFMGTTFLLFKKSYFYFLLLSDQISRIFRNLFFSWSEFTFILFLLFIVQANGEASIAKSNTAMSKIDAPV